MPVTITQLDDLDAETMNAVKKARFLIMAWPGREINSPPISHWHDAAYECFDEARTLLGSKSGELIPGLVAHCQTLQIVQRVLTTFTPVCGGPHVDPLTQDEWDALSVRLVTEHSELYVRMVSESSAALRNQLLKENTDAYRESAEAIQSSTEAAIATAVANQTPKVEIASAPPADEFAALRQFACDELKGQERAVLEAVCESRGKLPIADLAVRKGVDWDDVFQGFKDAQRRLNPKLKQRMFTISRQDNCAVLKPVKGLKRG